MLSRVENLQVGISWAGQGASGMCWVSKRRSDQQLGYAYERIFDSVQEDKRWEEVGEEQDEPLFVEIQTSEGGFRQQSDAAEDANQQVSGE